MANNETTFIFRKSKYFWKFINKAFDLSDMNDIFLNSSNEGDYTFILAEQVPTDIYSCIDSTTGCLIDDADGLDILDLQDVYSNIDGAEMPYFQLYCDLIQDGENGFSLNMDSGSTEVQIQLGDSQTVYLQGIFLCKRETKSGNENFVLAYATIPNPINVRNFITVPFDGVIVSVGLCSNTN